MKMWAVISRPQKKGEPLWVTLHHGVPPAIHKEDRVKNGGPVLEDFELIERHPLAGQASYTLREVRTAWILDKCATIRAPVPPPAPKEKTRPSWDIPEWKAIRSIEGAYAPMERMRERVAELGRPLSDPAETARLVPRFD